MIKKILLITTICIVVTSCGTAKAHKPHKNNEKKSELVRNNTETIKKDINLEEKTPHIVEETEELVATSKIKTSKNAVEEYIDLYKDIAMANMKRYGIPASIKLAQGILESGAGRGRLCMEANNHFGIKCKENWKGETFNHTDDAPNECFRKYNTPLESYNDHSEFLANRIYYRNLFKLSKDDYKGWAYGLKKAGYATDPKYPQKLINLIEKYNLYQYDNEVLNKPNIVEENNIILANNDNENTAQNDFYYTVKSGDSLYALSKRFNISIEKLKELNNLKSNQINIGQILKISQ